RAKLKRPRSRSRRGGTLADGQQVARPQKAAQLDLKPLGVERQNGQVSFGGLDKAVKGNASGLGVLPIELETGPVAEQQEAAGIARFDGLEVVDAHESSPFSRCAVVVRSPPAQAIRVGPQSLVAAGSQIVEEAVPSG